MGWEEPQTHNKDKCYNIIFKNDNFKINISKNKLITLWYLIISKKILCQKIN